MPKQSWTERARSQPLFFWMVVLLGAAMLGEYVFTGTMIWRYGSERKDLGWVLLHRDHQWIVSQVDSSGPGAGKLQAGDVIVAVNDHAGIGPRETNTDKARFKQMIGRGGMGAVYEAMDLRLNRNVAIKVMLGNMFGDRTALRRFEREGQASAR